MDRFKPCRFLAWSKPVRSRRSASFSLIIFATALLALSGCNRTGEESGACPIAYNTSGLPNVTLTDQYGQHVLLSSLRGKPVLFDFIYTSCPGPCQLLTQHMKLIADQLGPALGPKVSFGPDGHPTVEYSQQVDPSKPAHDAEEAAASTTTLIGRLSADLRQL
jgi:SCO1/SenC